MLTDRARRASHGFVQPIALAAGRLGLSPDQLTLLGVVLHLPAAWALAQGRFGWGAVLVALASGFDALDGTLARTTGRVTDRGAFLDSCLDRVSEIIVFAGLTWHALQTADSRLAFAAYAAITGSLMVSYSRARSEGLGRQTKAGVFGRLERVLVLVAGLATGLVFPAVVLIAVGAWITAIHRMSDVAAASPGREDGSSGVEG